MDPTTIVIATKFFEVLKLATIFAFVLAIIWLRHYSRTKKSQVGMLAEDERAALEDLTRIAGKLDERVGTLEKILDADDPKWRDRAA